jgi:protein gp37
MAGNRKFGVGEQNEYSNLVAMNSSGGLNWTGLVRFLPDRLEAIAAKRKSRLVFVNSLSDLFHEDLPDDVIVKHFELFNKCPQHQFQILTKRSENLLRWSPRISWPENVWQGVTVEHPKESGRILHLAKTGAKIKWVSFEPLLSGERPLSEIWPDLRALVADSGISWVVVGGESSKSKDVARVMALDDARYILTECVAAGARVLLKQLGTRWAISSGTYRSRADDPPRMKRRNGGARELWPRDLQTANYEQYPDVK